MREDGANFFEDRAMWPYITGLVVVTLGVGIWVGAMANRKNWDGPGDGESGFSVVVDGDFEWMGGTATLASPLAIVIDGEDYYILSTAPGARWENFPNGQIPVALYHSTDAQTWEAAPMVDGFRPSRLAVHDAAVYAVSTGPGTREGTVAVRIGRSTDAGTTWDMKDLDMVAPDPVLGSFHSTRVEVVAGPVGTLAYGSVSASFDPWTLVPPEFRQGNKGPETTPTGVRVLDYEAMDRAHAECGESCGDVFDQPGVVVYEATWEELGVDPSSLGSRNLFFTSDGVNYQRVDAPVGDLQSIWALEDGFALRTGTGQMWRSVDGLTWGQVDGPPIDWIAAMGPFDGGVLAVGDEADRVNQVTIAWSPNGIDSWEPISLEALGFPPDLSTWSSSVQIADGRAAALVGISDKFSDRGTQSWNLVVGTSRQDWAAVSLSSLLMGDGWIDQLMIGPDRVSVTVTRYSEVGTRAMQYVATLD